MQGKVDKLQFVNSSGSTVTISKTAAQIVNNADSTQVWTVSASLKADTYIVKSKIGTAWIDSDYSYTVTYDARPAVDETAFTVDISGKTATFSVTTAANASKIQFVTDSGSTITFSAADYSVIGADGLRHWTIVRTVKASGTGSYALKVKTTVWTDTGKSVFIN